MVPQGLVCFCFRNGLSGAAGCAVADAPLAAADIGIGAEALQLLQDGNQVFADRPGICGSGDHCGRKHRHKQTNHQQTAEESILHGTLPLVVSKFTGIITEMITICNPYF